MQTTQKKLKGLAALSPERRREIGSMGGKRAHELGRAHRWTAEEASEMGRKGGKIGKRGPNKSAVDDA